jgi:MSHA biogenesis protein MshQ
MSGHWLAAVFGLGALRAWRPPLLAAARCGGMLLALSAPLSAQATITYVGASTTAGAEDTTSVSVAKPTGLASGDVMLAFVATRGNGVFPTPITAPSGWTQVLTDNNGTSISTTIFSKVATASEAAQYAFTIGSNARAAGAIVAFRGVDNTTPVNVSGSQTNAASTTYTAPSVTTTKANTMLVSFFAATNGNGSVSTATGMTQAFAAGTTAASSGVVIGSSYATQATAGASGTKTSAANTSLTSSGATVALTDDFPLPVLDLRMDETSWTSTAGGVNDSSSNNLDGTATTSNSALPSITTGAVCTGGSFSSGYVNVPYNAALNPTNATFSFWIYPTSSGSYYPIIAKYSSSAYDYVAYIDSNGKLVFGWGSYSASSSYQPANKLTTSSAIPLNTWTHVAIVFNDTGNAQAVYLNGSSTAAASATSTSSLNTSTNALQIGYVNAGGWIPLQFNGRIDELKIFKVVLTTSQIATIYSNESAAKTYDGTTRSCPVSGPNHYELSLPSSSIACLASTVTVTACATSTTPCTSAYTAASGGTATLATSGATLGATSVTFNSSGVATTTLSYPAATNGTAATVTLSGESIAATSARQCCPNGSSCSAANSCSTTFNTAGFIVASSTGGSSATVPAQTAGTSSGTLYLRAVQTSTSTGACTSALTGSTTVNWAAQCNNPTTCSSGSLMTLTGTSATAIAGNANGSTASSTAVAMTFDASGNAPFSFNYANVGQVTLYATKAASGSLLSALSGNTNAFVVKPAALVLSNIKQTASPNLVNPAAASATGSKFVKAGESFTATVTAQTSGGAAAPNFGKETTPEGVTLTPTLVLPSGGVAGSLSNGSVAGGSFTSGAATVTTLSYSEVGIISLTPAIADGDYLGAGSVTGTSSGNVGRFVPAQFALSSASVTNRSALACSPASSFSYLGENFRLGLTLTAQNTSGATTQNYSGSFAKFDPTSASNWNLAGRDGSTVFNTSNGRLSLGTATGSFASGVASGVTITANAPRQSTADGPFGAVFGVAPADSDGVAMASFDMASSSGGSNDRSTVGTLALRFGRLRLSSAIGAADRTLSLPAAAQYWTGSAWDTNTLDSCTAVATTAVNYGNLRKTLTSADLNATSGITMASGIGTLKLAAPGGGRSGTVDVALSLASGTTDASCLQTWTPTKAATAAAGLAYLRGGWCGSNLDKDAAARASFGLQRTQENIVYRRENF